MHRRRACPSPALYVVDDPAPNAFATGRNPRNAAIAVTTGLLDKMNRIELEGVLAHELSPRQELRHPGVDPGRHHGRRRGPARRHRHPHAVVGHGPQRAPRLRPRDGGNSGPLAILSVVGFALLLLSPLIATVMQRAVSRRRETLADVSGVEMTRYPPGLISALEKLRDDSTVVHATSRATAHLWIEQPAAQTEREGRLSRFNRLFDTHPPIEERIAAAPRALTRRRVRSPLIAIGPGSGRGPAGMSPVD